jgi:hypothetical protein
MRIVAGAVCALALALAPAAQAVVIRTNWVERTQVSSGGTYTIYVRRIEVTKTTWRAWVGLVNRTHAPMRIQYGLQREGPRATLVHGPGMWFQGPIAPGAGVSASRHADATSVRPPLPHTLQTGRSWFATIEGPTGKLPKDRLMRIGLGYLVKPDSQYNTEISTTHQFKLPRRL